MIKNSRIIKDYRLQRWLVCCVGRQTELWAPETLSTEASHMYTSS